MAVDTNTPPQGLKARIEALLALHADEALAANVQQPGLTIGQISVALGLTKVDHPDISSVLVKLRNAGRLRSSLGPASSARGKRFVKRHTLAPPKAEKVVVVREDDLRRQLAFNR